MSTKVYVGPHKDGSTSVCVQLSLMLILKVSVNGPYSGCVRQLVDLARHTRRFPVNTSLKMIDGGGPFLTSRVCLCAVQRGDRHQHTLRHLRRRPQRSLSLAPPSLWC